MSLRLKARVDLDGVVHKHDKSGFPLTELTLALPSGVDLRLLRRAARGQKSGKEDVTARLHVEDEDGNRRTFNLVFVRSSTKDFVYGIVMQLDFNPRHNLEHYLSGYVMRDTDDSAPHLDFDVEIRPINASPLLEAAQGLQDTLNGSAGLESVTISYQGKSATLTADTGRKASAMLAQSIRENRDPN